MGIYFYYSRCDILFTMIYYSHVEASDAIEIYISPNLFFSVYYMIV